MSASGAKVLMLRAVQLARNQDVPIQRARRSRTSRGLGPGCGGLEHAIVSAVTHSEDEVLFDLVGVPNRPGSAAAIFEAVAAEHVNVDTILQNVGHDSAELSFSVPQDDVDATRRALARAQETMGKIQIDEFSDLGKVALIGAGVRSIPAWLRDVARQARNSRPAAGRWRSRTTTASRRSPRRRSHRTDDGSSSPSRRGSRMTTARGPRRSWCPPTGPRRPARVAHYGKDVTSPSWTFDSRLEYAAERERWTVDPQNLSTSPAKAAALPAGAVVSADTKWIAFAKDKPQPKTERAYASDFEKRHEERFKGVTFDWKDFQRDGAPFPAPNLRARPRRADRGPAGRRRRGEGPRRHRPSPRRHRLASGRTTARVHGRSRLARRAEVRQRDALDGHDRRQGHAGHRRRLRPRRRRFLAGRQVPVLRAQLRHGHDHQAEAESRRVARPVRPAGRRRPGDQPHRELGSRAERRALVARRPVHLLQRRHRRREPSVPDVGAGRRRRAGDERTAAPGRRDDRQERSRRLPTRLACTTRRRTSSPRRSTAPASGG